MTRIIQHFRNCKTSPRNSFRARPRRPMLHLCVLFQRHPFCIASRRGIHPNTAETIAELPWYSYCFQTDKSERRHKELLQFLLKRKKFDFLLYTHFDDILHETEDESCKGDHYHLLVTGDFTTVTGGLNKPSQTYHLEWLRAQCKVHNHIPPSSRVVKNFNSYVEYLKVCPRNLVAYSDCFIELAESGFFHATEKEWNLQVQAYIINIRDNIPERPEVGPYVEPRPPAAKKPKLTAADHTFERVREYCRLSKCINSQGLINWAQKQDEYVKTHICTQLYRRRDFLQLVEKAIKINKTEKVTENWYSALVNYTPRKGTMSIGDSVQLLREWHNHNGIPLQSSSGGASLTELLDQVLSKKVEKKNCIIFYGGSNAGKSIVMRSAFSVFPDCATMYQGVNNNFMFECLEGAQCAMWEEALFGSAQQESIKLLLEGAPMSVAGTNRKNVQIDRVPIGITCNVLPWRSLLIKAHMTAFENRCTVLRCETMPHLEIYANRGRINPKAWLV